MEAAWDIETGKDFVKVGIFDTGIRWSHNDLSESNRPNTLSNSRIKGGFDYANDLPIDNNRRNDRNGHGTNVAGIIGAVRNNNKGIAGIAGGDENNGAFGVELFNFKTSDADDSEDGGDKAQFRDSDVMTGVLDAVFSNTTRGIDNSMHLINMSFGGGEFNPMVASAMNIAHKNQIIFTVSAGNEPIESRGTPQEMEDDKVILVGASGDDGEYCNEASNSGSSFFTSSFSENLDIIAPGVQELIHTTDIGPRWPTPAGALGGVLLPRI